MNTKQIGQNIKKARKALKMTQAELAEQANMSAIHVSHLETGKANLTIDTLYDFCKILNVTPNDILAGEYMAASVDSMVFYERSNKLDYSDKLLLQHIFKYMEERNK